MRALMRCFAVILAVVVLVLVVPIFTVAAELPTCSKIVSGGASLHASDPAWLRLGTVDFFGNFQWCELAKANLAAPRSGAEPSEESAMVVADDDPPAPVVVAELAELPVTPRRAGPTELRMISVVGPDLKEQVSFREYPLEYREREPLGSRYNVIAGGFLFGAVAGDTYETIRLRNRGGVERGFLMSEFAKLGTPGLVAGQAAKFVAVWEGSRFLRNVSCGREGLFPKIGCGLGHVGPFVAGIGAAAGAQHNQDLVKRLSGTP